MTLRHLLLHTSGLSHSDVKLIQQWRDADNIEQGDCHPLHFECSMPLLFEPGEGYEYGSSIRASQWLLERLTGLKTEAYTQDNVFKVLGMSSTTYIPSQRDDIISRSLRMVERGEDGKVKALDRPMYGLTSCASDLHTLMVDLMSPASKILHNREHIDMLFQPQFAAGSPPYKAVRSFTDNYGYPAGIPQDMVDPPVNWSMAGLVAEETLPLSGIPGGSVTWNGMPNMVWVMNRDKGLAMIFATQLLPVDDPIAVDMAMKFFQEAWSQFG